MGPSVLLEMVVLKNVAAKVPSYNRRLYGTARR
jgi:hypothetical protein